MAVVGSWWQDSSGSAFLRVADRSLVATWDGRMVYAATWAFEPDVRAPCCRAPGRRWTCLALLRGLAWLYGPGNSLKVAQDGAQWHYSTASPFRPARGSQPEAQAGRHALNGQGHLTSGSWLVGQQGKSVRSRHRRDLDTMRDARLAVVPCCGVRTEPLAQAPSMRIGEDKGTKRARHPLLFRLSTIR
jgi:hypothetical protein